MRGGPTLHARQGPAARPVNEAVARPYSHPAPYMGWNARDNLANMDPRDAIQMDNVFPGVQDVQLRSGSSAWATGAPANIHSLLAYKGPTISKLFASTNAGIYDVTGSGVIGAAVTTCTNGYWQSLNIATAGGNFLFAANGADPAKLYDGTTWTIPAITGVSSAAWNYIHLHKHRIWAIEQNTMNLWYLPVDSIAGAATVFPVGALFKEGGHLVAIGTWLIDSGYSITEFFVIVTSNGEIAVYQGTDPASSTSWSLVGIYSVPRPVGKRPLITFGGDLLYLSSNGLLPMSKLRQSPVLDQSSGISYKIDGAFLDAVTTYQNNQGWQMTLHKSANMLLVNVPVSQDAVSYQFVMNTINKAWCRFTGWNASCMVELNGSLYFGAGTEVDLAWVGATDKGKPIIGTVLQAYSSLGSKGQKNVSLVRPNFGLSGAAQINMALDADFNTFHGQTVITYMPHSTGAIWDSSLWDSGLWADGGSTLEPKWTTIPGNPGNLHSFRLQVTSSSGNFIWTSTDFAFRPAGIL